MTEIKRSFYVLIAFMAILVFMPLLKSADFMRSTVSDYTLSHGLVSKVLILSNEPANADIVQRAESVHALSVNNSPKNAIEADVCSASVSISHVPQSTLFGIASTSASPMEITEKEREMIAAAVQLEVLGKYSTADQFERPDLKYYEMLAVAQIVRNRILNENFPDDIKTVIYDSSYTKKGLVYQFSTSPYIYGTEPSELAYAAVDEVFNDGVTVLPDDYYYFCATWREDRFEINNRSVLKFLGSVGDYDKIVADATTFYAGVTIDENKKSGYVF